MPRRRTVSALFATAAIASVAWFTTTVFPLQAQPQVMMADSAGVTVNMNGGVLLHRVPISYPRPAEGAQTGGTVLAEVRMDAAGNVTDARILSGPDELRKTVLESVLSWHFAKSAGQTQQVSVTFQPQALPPVNPAVAERNGALAGVGPTIKQIEVRGLSEQAKQELLAALPIHVGDMLTTETNEKLHAVMRRSDEHLGLMFQSPNSNEVSITLAPSSAVPGLVPRTDTPAASVPGQIRVAGNVQQANLISQQKPVYPSLAKAARVQGTVQFEVVIDKEGKISNLHLISGPPLLVQAAMQAVQKWVYKPTMLNGNPVEVITTIDVNFTLAPDIPAVPAPPQ